MQITFLFSIICESSINKKEISRQINKYFKKKDVENEVVCAPQ